MIYSQSELR